MTFVDKLLLTKHLSVMIKSGIPLAESLSILEKQTTNRSMALVIGEINREVSNGKTFHEALEKFPKIFDSLYISLITVGEESGNLEKNLEYLAIQLSKNYEFRKKVQSALLYPGFVVGTAIVLGGGISIFVLPQLSSLFSSLDIELPFSTQILMAIAGFMKNYGLIAIPGAFLFMGFMGILVNTRWLKYSWHRLLLSLPVFGTFLQNSESASFCRNLGLMVKSGFPLVDGLRIIADSASNVVFRRYILDVAKAVEGGQTIESELENRKKYRYLPAIVARMIGVGERTGKLDETLLYLGDFFEEEVDNMAKNLPTILEPILLTGIAMVVAFIAMAIISPIYQFTSSVHK